MIFKIYNNLFNSYQPGKCHYNIKYFIDILLYNNMINKNNVTIYIIHNKGKSFRIFNGKLWYFHVFCVINNILYDFDFISCLNNELITNYVNNITSELVYLLELNYDQYNIFLNMLKLYSSNNNISSYFKLL